MKVAIISYEAHKLGGVGRYTYELAKSVEGKVFGKVGEGIDYKIHSPGGIDLVSKNLFPFWACKVIKKSNWDIIHSQGASYFIPDVVTGLTSQKKMIELVEKGELFLEMKSWQKEYWKIRLKIAYVLEKFTYFHAQKIIAISKLVKEEIKKDYKIKDEKIEVIYPGVNLEEFHPSKTLRERVRSQLNVGGIVLLFVGSQWGRKGLKYLLQAIKDENYTLLVIGEEEKIEKVPPNVKFLGMRSNLVNYYNASDILVAPSLFDAFNLSVLEGLACGIPAVVSKYAGASEIVGKGGVILENPKDWKEIKEKIHIVKNNLEKMKKEAQKEAVKYDWKIIGEEIKKIYQEIKN